MSTLSSANVTDVNLVLKKRTHMHLCLNMLIFTHNLGNWLIKTRVKTRRTAAFRHKLQVRKKKKKSAGERKESDTAAKRPVAATRSAFTRLCLRVPGDGGRERKEG